MSTFALMILGTAAFTCHIMAIISIKIYYILLPFFAFVVVGLGVGLIVVEKKIYAQ